MFISGGVSGALAVILVYPFDLTKTILALQHDKKTKYNGIFSTIINVACIVWGVHCLLLVSAADQPSTTITAGQTTTTQRMPTACTDCSQPASRPWLD